MEGRTSVGCMYEVGFFGGKNGVFWKCNCAVDDSDGGSQEIHKGLLWHAQHILCIRFTH